MAPQKQMNATELAECVRASGRPAVLSEGGNHVWIPGVRGELQRLPMEATATPAPETIREVLGQKGIWIASYMQTPDADRPANCFDYVCTDPEYDISKLDKNRRRDVRRGLRRFSVRRCTWDELAENGYQAYADTESRHEHGKPNPQDLHTMAEQDGACPLIEIWGAWQNNKLAAWIRVIKADEWAFITSAYSANWALSDCPNNAITYEATRLLLCEDGQKQVSYGISSIQSTPNILSLHRFKIRMGFEPRPMHRTFVLHPLLRPLFQWQACSRLWDLASRLRPGSAAISKAAGLARLLSNRVSSPLSWTQE